MEERVDDEGGAGGDDLLKRAEQLQRECANERFPQVWLDPIQVITEMQFWEKSWGCMKEFVNFCRRLHKFDKCVLLVRPCMSHCVASFGRIFVILGFGLQAIRRRHIRHHILRTTLKMTNAAALSFKMVLRRQRPRVFFFYFYCTGWFCYFGCYNYYYF